MTSMIRSLSHKCSAIARRMIGDLHNWRHPRRALRTIREMTAEQLDDIGLTEDIVADAQYLARMVF